VLFVIEAFYRIKRQFVLFVIARRRAAAEASKPFEATERQVAYVIILTISGLGQR
jgi:hypothetical protein